MVADMLRARAAERAEEALSRANQTLGKPRPFAGAADGWAREGDGATVPQSPAPSRAAPPAAVADDDDGFVRRGVLLALLQGVIVREREHAAKSIEGLARRVAVLEARLASGETKKGRKR